MLKAGFIGTGGISQKYLSAMAEMKDKVEIAALCDAREEAAKARAATYGGKVYTDYKKMLDDEDLNVVFICVPPDSHKDMEILAAQKGLHMLVEKPVNLYMDDAIRANEAIKKAGVVTCVGYTAGYSNVDQAIKKFLADKKIGMVSSERWGGVAGDENHWWRVMDRSGGMLHEQATHQLNTVRYFAGDAIKQLPQKYQDVLTLRYFADKKINEIAIILGKPEGTIKSLLHRGLEKLKRNL